jgi:hypothetical protein
VALPAKIFLDVANDKLTEHTFPLQCTPPNSAANNTRENNNNNNNNNGPIAQPANGGAGSVPNGPANVTTGTVRLVVALAQFWYALRA